MASDEKTSAPLTSSPTELELDSNSNNQCSLDGCIEESSDMELTCKICEEQLKEPKVLSCLHAFCQACLEQKVIEESNPIDDEPTKTLETFACPVSFVLVSVLFKILTCSHGSFLFTCDYFVKLKCSVGRSLMVSRFLV